MSPFHRDRAKQGLPDERWNLISRYMGRSEEPPPAAEETVPLEEERAPLPIAEETEAMPEVVEAAPAEPLGSLVTPPPAPAEPVRAEDLGTALRTLAEVNRLCEQMGRMGAEGDRLRALIADVSSRLAPRS